jgi:hypothetical protein
MTAAYVQVVCAALAGSSTSAQAVTVAANTSSGHTLYATVRTTAGKVLSSVTDTQSNTWNVDQHSAGTQTNVAIASCQMATPLTLTGNAGGADIITFHFSGSCTPASGVIECSGIASSGSPALATLDQTNVTSDTSGAVSSCATTSNTAQGGDMVISAEAQSDVLVTCTVTSSDPDSGGTWTQPALGIDGCGIAYQVGGGSASLFSTTWTSAGGTTNLSTAIAAYTPAGGTTPVSSADTDSGTDAGELMHVDDAQGYP